MKIQKEPYPIDFAGNSPEFVVRTTPNFTDGRPYTRTFVVNTLPAGDLVMEIDEETLTWHLSNDPGDGLYDMMAAPTGVAAMLDTLEAKLLYNPVLNRDFTASCAVRNGQLQVKVTAREPGGHLVTLRHSGSPLFVTSLSYVSGRDGNPKPRYRVKAWFSIVRNGSTEQTPAMLLEDSGGTVRIPTDMLRPLFGKPDIPRCNKPFEPQPCPANSMAVRLMAGEMHADTDAGSPTLRTLQHSRRIILVNGELHPYAAQNNIPDWIALDGRHLHLKNGLDIFGQDNDDTVATPHDAPQYLYLYNYSAEPVTEDIRLSLVFADGSVDDGFAYTRTFQPGLSRVEVGLEDLQLDHPEEVVRWSAAIGGIRRTFLVRDFAWGFHTFLMLNALNLYETFIVEELSREEQTEGERRVMAGIDGYGTTDRQTVFTAKCHPRNAKGLKLLRTAFAKQDNLLLEGEYAWRIDMLPGSLAVSDESADVLAAEFQFRLREKVNRNPQTIAASGEIAADAQVAATDTEFK